jgi:hypothetical protein
MTLLIQRANGRATLALHAKLVELLRLDQGARTMSATRFRRVTAAG